MYILFAISFLCLFVLAITAIAVSRHVRSNGRSEHEHHTFAEHLFAAAAGKRWNSALEPIQANTRSQTISSMRS
jgi:K+-transporting ATPase A subunit